MFTCADLDEAALLLHLLFVVAVVAGPGIENLSLAFPGTSRSAGPRTPAPRFPFAPLARDWRKTNNIFKANYDHFFQQGYKAFNRIKRA